MYNPVWGHRPVHQVTEPPKFWKPSSDEEEKLFLDAKTEVKLFLMSKNEGVDVNKLLELIQKYGTKGEIKFKDFGFKTFNEFLFHIDDVYELRTEGTVLYLFFKGEVDENQQHIRTFVAEQKKDAAGFRFVALKENTYVVPSYYLIQPPKPTGLAIPHQLMPNPPFIFQQQQHQFYYNHGFMQVPHQFYMGIPFQHQFQQSYNMTNFFQNPGIQYQFAYNQQQKQGHVMMMNAVPNQQYQNQQLHFCNNSNDIMMRQQQLGLAQNGRPVVYNHLSVPLQQQQQPFLTIHPKPQCPVHPFNSPSPPPEKITIAASINNNNNNNDSDDEQESNKENSDVINENASDLEPKNNPLLNFKNPETVPKLLLGSAVNKSTLSSKTEAHKKTRKVSLRQAVEKMLEESSVCSSSSSSSTVPDTSCKRLLSTTPSSSPPASLIPAVPVTENNSNSSLVNEVRIEDLTFATISPHSDVKETIKEKVTTRNFTSLQQSVNDLLKMEEEEEMRKVQEERKKNTIYKNNSTELDRFINPDENSNHSLLEIKESSDIQEQKQAKNNIKSKEKQNPITVKQIQLVNSGWLPYRLLGVDMYGHFILKPSDPKVNEYFDKEMEKMDEFYSSVENQYKYRLDLDNIKVGMFVVIRLPLVKQDNNNNMKDMKARRYLRAKIFFMEDREKFITCMGLDDAIEYMIHFNDIFHLKLEFSRPTARAIMTILEGTEKCFLLPDIAKAFRKCQSHFNTRIHPIVKVQVVQEKHPLFQSPVVKIETNDGRDLFKILFDINPSINKAIAAPSCNLNDNMNDDALQSFSTYQNKVFTELVRRGYIGNNPNSKN